MVLDLRSDAQNADNSAPAVVDSGSEACDEKATEDGALSQMLGQVVDSNAEDRMAAEDLLKAAQMRIECVKVCAPAQFVELVEASNSAVARMRAVKNADGLRRLRGGALAEYASLQSQWQQRSGTIRVVVRVRPSTASDESDPAVRTLPGNVRGRGLVVSVPSGRIGRSRELHAFKRFDYVLGFEMDQEGVFNELKGMLPSAMPGGFAGPAQSACILAYGQTGSGKTYTMHGAQGLHQGLVPRVFREVFHMVSGSQATISLSAIEIYNDLAYDLLDGTRGVDGEAGRAFQPGRLPPPPGLNFRHGCASALEQATSVTVGTFDAAFEVLSRAADRRSTRSTVFNATSSRSHSLIFLYAHTVDPRVPDSEPALRLAFVDLAGSERLPAGQAGGVVAEESRHINLSLSSLGSVIHALRHHSNHLPFRNCLMTRLLEPYFGSFGRVLLFVCVSPERRHASETLCSLNFAERASRALLGADSSLEVQRSQTLAVVREAYAVHRALITCLLPSTDIVLKSRQRLPDGVAAEILSFVQEYGAAAFVCRAWAKLCDSRQPWGREFRQSRKLARSVLQWLDSPMRAGGVCRCWWREVGAFLVILEASSAKVLEACAGSGHRMWMPTSATTRTDLWKALLAAGGGSGARGAYPLGNVRECIISAAPKADALKQMLIRCSELRVAEITEPSLMGGACDGIAHCTKLRALRCAVPTIPLFTSMAKVLQSCRGLIVLSISGNADLYFSLFQFTDCLPKSCGLRELSVEYCVAEERDIDRLVKSCSRLRTLRLPRSFVQEGDALSVPPLLPLPRLKYLNVVDFRASIGRVHRQRPWLTDNMFGTLGQLRDLREIRANDQKLLGDQCLWFLRRHSARLQVLHLSGCKAMAGDLIFSVVHTCLMLESLRLPSLVVGQSTKKLGISTNRWCQGLQCPRLIEMCVDAWPTLEDSGVQMLVSQCCQLRTLQLRQASRLSNDAVAYLVTLRNLNNLSIAHAVGITDDALAELASATRLQCLDLTGCCQLTDTGVVNFAAALSKPLGPRLQTFILDHCHKLGRASVEALAGVGVLRRCSFLCCRPLPEIATVWGDDSSRTEACRALGIQPPVLDSILHDNGAREARLPSSFCRADPSSLEGEPGELAQCAVCLDEIRPDEPTWQCAVCCNRLHDWEDCARGWLRLKQCCPTCRSAAWAPPEEERGRLQGRRRSSRSLSAEPRSSNDRPQRISPNRLAVLPSISANGVNIQLSQSGSPGGMSSSRSVAPLRGEHGYETGSRRPPRPSAPSVIPNRLAAALSGATASAPLRSGPVRSNSLPPRGRLELLGLSLVGLSIVGSVRA